MRRGRSSPPSHHTTPPFSGDLSSTLPCDTTHKPTATHHAAQAMVHATRNSHPPRLHGLTKPGHLVKPPASQSSRRRRLRQGVSRRRQGHCSATRPRGRAGMIAGTGRGGCLSGLARTSEPLGWPRGVGHVELPPPPKGDREAGGERGHVVPPERRDIEHFAGPELALPAGGACEAWEAGEVGARGVHLAGVGTEPGRDRIEAGRVGVVEEHHGLGARHLRQEVVPGICPTGATQQQEQQQQKGQQDICALITWLFASRLCDRKRTAKEHQPSRSAVKGGGKLEAW